jgi:hypothetical protein
MHIRTNPKLNKLFKPIVVFCEWLGVHHPILLARMRYFARFRKPLHLKDPQTLNEKILFLSLKTDTSFWTDCTDKYKVREYVRKCGLADILVKLYGVWDKATDIDFNILPDEFVLKATHGSGDIKVVPDKSKLDIPAVVAEFEKDLKTKYGALESGHHYLRIKPRMIAEELLHNDPKTEEISFSIIDYKIWCFNGRACWVWVCANRDEHTTEVMTYDMDWNAHPEFSVFEKDYRHGKVLPKPKSFNRMIEVAEILSKPFPCVRVDLYNIDGRVYFGELTFTSYGGLQDFYTDEFQLLAGSQIDLSGVKAIK